MSTKEFCLPADTQTIQGSMGQAMNIKTTSGATAYTNAELGIRKGERALATAAVKVANANGSPARDQNLQRALIDSHSASQQIKASAKALERANQALGSFIDTLV